MKLLVLSSKFPDGFTLVLPDSSLMKIEWLFGHEIEEAPRGIKIRNAFGVRLSGDFGETTITVYVTGK